MAGWPTVSGNRNRLRLPHFFVSPGVGDTRVVTTNLCRTLVSSCRCVSSRPEHKSLRERGRAAIHGRDSGGMDALKGWPGLKPALKADCDPALKGRPFHVRSKELLFHN